jgi:prepilin-type N-terminal cleavage/methylation domain-containing protein
MGIFINKSGRIGIDWKPYKFIRLFTKGWQKCQIYAIISLEKTKENGGEKMFQLLSKKLRKKQGFTLIELIVVLAILGIILAIAVPNYLGVQERSAVTADDRASELAMKAVDLWLVSNSVSETDFEIQFNVALATGADPAVLTDANLANETAAGEAATNVGTLVPNFMEASPAPQATVHAGQFLQIDVDTSSQNLTASWVTPVAP